MTEYQWKVILAMCRLMMFHWYHNGPDEDIEIIKEAIERSEQK